VFFFIFIEDLMLGNYITLNYVPAGPTTHT
jgi:hypothetical protein